MIFGVEGTHKVAWTILERSSIFCAPGGYGSITPFVSGRQRDINIRRIMKVIIQEAVTAPSSDGALIIHMTSNICFQVLLVFEGDWLVRLFFS